MKALALIALSGLLATAQGKDISYNRDIRPILSDNCFACHGFDPKNRKADLRLDTFEGATVAGGIVPGDPSKSEVWNRILSEDADEVMPPPKTHKRLNATQKDLIKRWIESGAKYQKHWAFEPLAPAAVPLVKQKEWPRNDLDRFILARLEEEGVHPSPEAKKETLIRRWSLDLTGLPPTPDLAALSEDHIIERLLESPHYGERMALDWLDAARYADTNGYQVDRDREMWPWRDWVVSAFNANMPFDQFTIEQLAGDLLPNASIQQRLATGFNRNHMINEEGGIIAEEFLAEYTADRVETTAAVWLGQTFNCCRCHDHKYDPFTAKDFYSLKAFFHNVPEQGVGKRNAKPNASAPPILTLPTPELDAEKKAIEANQKALRERRAEWMAKPQKGFDSWLERLASSQPRWQRIPFASVTSEGLPSEIEGGAVRAGLQIGDNFWKFHASSVPLDARISAIRLVGEAIDEQANFRANQIALFTVVNGKKVPVELRAGMDGDSMAESILQPFLRRDNRQPYNLILKPKVPKIAVFRLLSPLSSEKPSPLFLTVGARGNTGTVRWHLEVTGDDADLLVPAQVRGLVTKPAHPLTAAEKDQLKAAYAATLPDIRALDDTLLDLQQRLGDLELEYPASMVMAEMEKPRETFILSRGAYDKRGEKVTAATPTVLPAMPDELPRNRLGLAKWLVSPQNPLTARVTVNRLWQQVFGTGLVKTSEDFGAQGESPSHPELLDWLAGEFVRSGWDVKRLMKLMLTSATYRQQSHLTPQLRERDPDNRLLARSSRVRLPGELIRDQALAVSGLLVPRIGGPPVRPYHPPGMYEALAPTSADTVRTYVQDHGDSLYRRSLYTYWKRSIPHPALLSFGTPFREVCTLRRPNSNTPLQALNLMNDTTYVEAARHLAARAIKQSEASPDSLLSNLFQMVLARNPNAQEQAILQRSYERALADFKNDPESAAALLQVGDKASAQDLDAAQLASLTTLASTLLCMDETVTKP
jgi:hypothetical protein